MPEKEPFGCLLEALLTLFIVICTTVVVAGEYWLLWKVLDCWFVDYGIWRY